jgi:hypothetical protein
MHNEQRYTTTLSTKTFIYDAYIAGGLRRGFSGPIVGVITRFFRCALSSIWTSGRSSILQYVQEELQEDNSVPASAKRFYSCTAYLAPCCRQAWDWELVPYVRTLCAPVVLLA